MIGATSSTFRSTGVGGPSEFVSVASLVFDFLSFRIWFLVLGLSGAEPTILGGGELARETSFEYIWSEIAGVEGWLREMLEIEGCREHCLPSPAGKTPLFSAMAEAGVVSDFWVIVVVTRIVLGHIADVSDILGATSAGVTGRLEAGGVATMEAANAWFSSVVVDCIGAGTLVSLAAAK
jgi:hypothetical protein